MNLPCKNESWSRKWNFSYWIIIQVFIIVLLESNLVILWEAYLQRLELGLSDSSSSDGSLTAVVIGIKSWKETTIVEDNNKINDNEATPSELVQPKNRVLQMRENIQNRIASKVVARIEIRRTLVIQIVQYCRRIFCRIKVYINSSNFITKTNGYC